MQEEKTDLLAQELWTYSTEDAILGIKAIDISGDGKIELIAHSKSGDLYILSSRGELLFHNNIAENASLWCSECYDLTGNGIKDLILGGYDGLLRTFQFSEQYTLEPLWAHQFGGSISGILLDDINNDGETELIVYSLDQSLRVLKSSDGTLLWGQMFEEGIGDALVWKTSANGDDTKEVYAAGNDNTIRAFKGEDGGLLWFKRFTNKVRCIDYIRADKADIIFCGGDDKELHIINRDTQEEVKNIPFEDYLWKTLAYPPNAHEQMIVTTYSFAYFDETVFIEDITFTSKIVKISQDLEIDWEIPSKNVECIDYMELDSTPLLAAGTTKGEFLLIDPQEGGVLLSVSKESCLNGFAHCSPIQTLYTAHDDGTIYAYKLEN